jgi:hypothetical protein
MHCGRRLIRDDLSQVELFLWRLQIPAAALLAAQLLVGAGDEVIEQILHALAARRPAACRGRRRRWRHRAGGLLVRVLPRFLRRHRAFARLPGSARAGHTYARRPGRMFII